MRDIIRAEQTYPAATRTFDIPPAAQSRFRALDCTFTRVAWPGAATIDLAATVAATTVRVPVGAVFPAAGGRLAVTSGGLTELMRLVSRAGRILTVGRGQDGTTPIPIAVGATILLLDLLTLHFQRTVNGVDWEDVGGATFAGGIAMTDARPGFPSVEQTTCGAAFRFNDAHGPISRPGDTRIVLSNRVTLTTAITAHLVEESD
jgi:hypothetical protein